jgi:hypothetical protein
MPPNQRASRSGRSRRSRHKVGQIHAELPKGTWILKTARLCGAGVSAVQRIKTTMKQTV